MPSRGEPILVFPSGGPLATRSSRVIRVSLPLPTPADAVPPRGGSVIGSRESSGSVANARAPVRRRDTSSNVDALSGRLPLLSTDIDMARMGSTNVLLIGPVGRCEKVIATLGPDLIEPIIACRAREGLALPPPAMVGALIIHGVDELAQADQQRLLDWLGDAVAVKVISTATAPLMPRIERGAFRDSLYYRLNTICILMMGAEEWRSA